MSNLNTKIARLIPNSPPWFLTYYRPWDEKSNVFDSWLDYSKDVSLQKYNANIIGKYLNQSSIVQVKAINELGSQVNKGFSQINEGLNKGFKQVSQGISQLSDQVYQGFSDIQNQLTYTNRELSFLNQNMAMQVELQMANNLLLENLSDLLRVPDSEKQRQHHIEIGLKFLANAKKDDDLYADALEEFMGAEELMKQDYFVLHRIGMIYLHAPKLIDPKKALDYFKRAAKYAYVESGNNATRLANILTKDRNLLNSKIYSDQESILLITAQSYEKGALAAYIIEDIPEAVNLGQKAVDCLPNIQNLFMLAKYQIRSGATFDAVMNLERAIEIQPSIIEGCFADFEIYNEPQVHKLIERCEEFINDKIKRIIYELKNSNSSISQLQLFELEGSLNEDYQKKVDAYNKIKLDIRLEKLRVGDRYGGGIIFYIDESGKHGLIVYDSIIQSPAPWGKNSHFIGTGTAIGDGKKNTELIIDNSSSDNKENDLFENVKHCKTAAERCAEFNYLGFSDWFLPSHDELATLFYSINKGLCSDSLDFEDVFFLTSSEANFDGERDKAIAIRQDGLGFCYGKFELRDWIPIREY